MGRALTTKERAQRQRVMMNLRKWMEENDIHRQDIANAMGVTRGHLSTLINANRIATDDQCRRARELMGDVGPAPAGVPIMEHKKVSMDLLARSRPKGQKKGKKKPKPKREPKPSKLRPLNKFESQFITEVAKVWIDTNPKATQDEFVEVIRALSIGIRSR